MPLSLGDAARTKLTACRTAYFCLRMIISPMATTSSVRVSLSHFLSNWEITCTYDATVVAGAEGDSFLTA